MEHIHKCMTLDDLKVGTCFKNPAQRCVGRITAVTSSTCAVKIVRYSELFDCYDSIHLQWTFYKMMNECEVIEESQYKEIVRAFNHLKTSINSLFDDK